MPVQALEKLKQVLNEADASVQEAVASAPVGFVGDMIPGFRQPSQHSMRIGVLGNFNTDFADAKEPMQVGKNVVSSLANTFLRQADVLIIETFNFLDDPRPREDSAVQHTAQLVKQASHEMLEGVVDLHSIDAVGGTLEPQAFKAYLPRAESKIASRHGADSTIAYLAVLGASRLGEGFGFSQADIRDGGSRQHVEGDWQRVSVANQLGLLRSGY